jgi:hypothetical protein
MNQTQPQQESNIGARDVFCSAWKLFGARFGAMLRFFYLHAGLMLLVLVTAAPLLRPPFMNRNCSAASARDTARGRHSDFLRRADDFACGAVRGLPAPARGDRVV